MFVLMCLAHGETIRFRFALFVRRGLLNVSLYHHNFAVSQQKLCRVELGKATLSRFRVGVCLIRHYITRIVLFSDKICVGLVLK